MKDFVPYNEALSLKELGFEEPCFSFYRNDRQDKKLEFTNVELAKNYNGINSKNLFIAKAEDLFLFTSCPTFSQAFRFFRKKYKLHSYIDGAYPWFRYYINSDNNKWEGHKYLKFEQAELECLRKLIEICKQSK